MKKGKEKISSFLFPSNFSFSEGPGVGTGKRTREGKDLERSELLPRTAVKDLETCGEQTPVRNSTKGAINQLAHFHRNFSIFQTNINRN